MSILRGLLGCWLVASLAAAAACADKQTDPGEDDSATQEAEAGAVPTQIDLWKGVPPLVPEADDIRANLEPTKGPLKPKTVGEVVEVPFPAESEETPPPKPTDPAAASGAPLQVLRFGPEGAPPLADSVRLSFSHPMVPLASVDGLRAKDPPIEIDPSFPGTPKWLGTKTFAFVADGRVPLSTTYRVTARAGLESTDGAKLPKDFSWEFTTPALTLASSTPHNGSTNVDLEPTIVLTFNQPVQRIPLLAALKMRGGSKSVELVEVPAPPPPEGVDPPEPWETARVVRLKPKAPLSPDTRYTIQIPAGVYGEGPNRSAPISLSFSTYPPLQLSYSGCRQPQCWASEGIRLDSTTTVADPKADTKIRVDPPVENMAVYAGAGISISGDFVGETTYTVEVDAGLEDRFGQKLAKPFKARVRVGPHYPALSLLSPGKDPAVIERTAGGKLPVRVAGLDQLEIHARSMGLDDVHKFIEWGYAPDWEWPSSLPSPSFDDLLDVSDSRQRIKTVELDLAKMSTATNNIGWLVARSNKYKIWDWEQRSGLRQSFQITDLGVSAVLDQSGGWVMVSSLQTGLPEVAAKVRTLDRYGKQTWSGITDPSGIAYVKTNGEQPRLVLVETEDDRAFLRTDSSSLRGGWLGYRGQAEDRPRAMFFTERTPYKPGETIHLVGVLRLETRGPQGTVKGYRTGGTAKYQVTTPRGIEVAKGEVEITPFGTFALDIETKEEQGTGNYNFQLTVTNLFSSNRTFYHAIPVETFRTPEFEVKVERPESSPLTFEETLVAEVKASYLHGAPLVGADVTWVLKRTDSGFRPPGELNEGFKFGQGYGYPGMWRSWSPPSYGGRIVEQGNGTTDTDGKLSLSHVLHVIDPPLPPKTGAKDKGEEDADDKPPTAATYVVETTVTDENRQAIGSQGSFVVHGSEVYVGLRTDRTVLREGERVRLEAVLVDLAGERVSGKPIALQLVRRVTERKAIEKDGRWQFKYETNDEKVGDCSLESGGVPASCDVEVGKPGSYVVRGSAKDADGRETLSELTIYVHGEDDVVWNQEQRRVDLVPDRSSYEPGDTAAILVRSPFTEATGVVVVEREGISRSIPVTVHGGATAVDIPITELMMPGVTVSALLTRPRVEVEGAPPGQDLGMPAAAVGTVDLDVSTASKTITVELEPSARELEPKGTLSLTVQTKDHEGNGSPAAVAIMVVDEGVLSLMNYQTPDPIAFFHRKRGTGTWMGALHRNVMPRQEPETASTTPAGGESAPTDASSEAYDDEGGAAPPAPEPDLAEESVALPRAAAAPMRKAEQKADKKMKRKSGRSRNKGTAGLYAMRGPKDAPGGVGGKLDAAQAMAQEVSLRSFFASTAFFDAEVRTDAQGLAKLEIPMPENLTTFRVMAVAIDPDEMDRFGKGETTVRVRKPIMLRPSMPRFANFGDAFEGSVMVDNQTGEDQQILVGTRGINVEMTGADQKMVEIPAGQSKEVRFDMKTMAVGTMRVQFAALSNGGRDATELSLPVRYPATSQAFADYGMTDGSVTRLVEPPKDALAGYGGLELSFSSTALNGLEDSVQYLVDYEYECAEQTASRLLPIFVLGKILDEFPIASVRDDWRRKNLANEGIEKLLAKQSYDGGFGYWKRDESWPYLTNWVTFALLEGKKAGFEVEEASLNRALNYVENFVRYGHKTRWGYYYDWTSRAFGLWLLSKEGKGSDLFATVWGHRTEMPLYARVLLMSAAHRYGKNTERDLILDELRKGVVETARTIHFAESTSEAASDGLRLLMHSNVQTDAIALMALLEVAPEDPMLPKVIAGILSERDPRNGGRWATTHANAWALLAASRYFETIEKEEPDFLAKIWLDDDFGGEIPFKGRSMAKVQQTVPMAKLAGAEQRTLTVAKDGPGKLYYRLGLKYAPQDLELEAEDQGFLVYRTYEEIPTGKDEPDPEAVKRLEDGSWQIKAGTNVKVTINLVVRDRANYVVVDDALPAGFEGQNPRFVTSVAASGSSTVSYGGAMPRRRWWYPWWSFDHTEMRDDRMLLFADRIAAGVYTYSYTARATSIGTFQLPPIKAEAMYEPERFGHSASSVVRVVE